jgi:hypothetical protein
MKKKKRKTSIIERSKTFGIVRNPSCNIRYSKEAYDR